MWVGKKFKMTDYIKLPTLYSFSVVLLIPDIYNVSQNGPKESHQCQFIILRGPLYCYCHRDCHQNPLYMNLLDIEREILWLSFRGSDMNPGWLIGHEQNIKAFVTWKKNRFCQIILHVFFFPWFLLGSWHWI